jgi:hypothetical protein
LRTLQDLVFSAPAYVKSYLSGLVPVVAVERLTPTPRRSVMG